MFKKFLSSKLAVASVAAFFLAPAMWAGQVAVGFVSWDVNFPGNAGQFDITNLTGPNAAPVGFPITTEIQLTGLSLTVDFVSGGTKTYGSSYFTLSSDGESLDGTAIPIGGTNPQPISATLSGTFSVTSILDPSADTILPTFTVTFSDSPTLVDGDFGIIYATECGGAGEPSCSGSGSITPEPNSMALVGLGLGVAGLLIVGRKKVLNATKLVAGGLL